MSSARRRLHRCWVNQGSSSEDALKGHAGAVPTHFPAKAKHIIYLHMVGGPSQLDLYDYKPQMNDWYDKDLPESVRNGQRLTTMTSGTSSFSDRSVEV
jgi:hypothetical protein